MRGHLFKYFTEREWAESFLDGNIRFRTLAYFRDYEDQIRGDRDEGNAVYRPTEGLLITNHTQGTRFQLPGYAFESTARQGEIFVFCLSRSFNAEIRKRLNALFCVEILRKAIFCNRVVSVLPANTKFPGASGYTKIGNDVEYYDVTQGGDPRWALPDKIAISKTRTYDWQNEFRLVFTLTDAFRFENVDTRLVSNSYKQASNPEEHHDYLLKTQSLRDICRLHQFT